MERPVVSVVMPAYNSEKTIGVAIDSVILQSFVHWELLIIVDPSKDSTIEIIKNYHDERIRLISNDRRLGIAESRNLGVREARGEWIAFLDSDDAWKAEKLEKQVAATDQSDLLFTGSAFMDENNKRINYELHVPAQVNYTDLLKQNIISCSSVLVKKTRIMMHPMPNVKDITEDYATWLSILRDIPYAVGIDEPLLIYRYSSSSDSSNKIKMVKKNWNTFKLLKVPGIQAIASLMSYGLRSLKKYRRLKGTQK